MKRFVSVSTTVRNPYRVREFLNVLKTLEGKVFNEKAQMLYQTLLIKAKLYEPVALPHMYKKYYEVPNDMPLRIAKDIFELMKSRSKELKRDPGLRGRTSVAPLSKMGLAIAKESSGKVKITELGNFFLENPEKLDEVFQIFLTRWQYPNPSSPRSFTKEEGFDTKPFITTIHLINEVNRRWEKEGNKPVGLSKNEFYLFVPSTIHFQDIAVNAKKIIKMRKITRRLGRDKRKDFEKKYWFQYLNEFYEGKKNQAQLKTECCNLLDYGDNILRYFRITKLISLRGGGFYVDLEPRRKIEIVSLLKTSPSAEDFANEKKYVKYLSSLKISLPWGEKTELVKILHSVESENRKLHSKMSALGILIKKDYTDEITPSVSLSEKISLIRKQNRYLFQLQQQELLQKPEEMEGITTRIGGIFEAEDKPLELEYLITLAFESINDAEEIKPNYPVDDENRPIFTAPGDVPDLECFYADFNLVSEVTLLRSRDQWFSEGQPVMRHTKDFIERHKAETFCIFLAPVIHRDTLNTFWHAARYGYEGKRLKIIPLNFDQFKLVLETIAFIRKQGRFFKSNDLREFLNSFFTNLNKHHNSVKWFESINKCLKTWVAQARK